MCVFVQNQDRGSVGGSRVAENMGESSRDAVNASLAAEGCWLTPRATVGMLSPWKRI